MLYLLQAEGKDRALVGVEPGRLGLGGETARTWAVFTKEGTPPHGYQPQEESLPSPWGHPPTPPRGGSPGLFADSSAVICMRRATC